MTMEKICPSCKHKNIDSAIVCSVCGTLLEGKPTDPMAVTEYLDEQPGNSGQAASTYIDKTLIPEGGIGVYIPSASRSLYAQVGKELILGREQKLASKAALDLSDLDAFDQGVSRRHALIRRTEYGFEIMDLASRNGTWLNALQLSPRKAYPLASGSQVRLGRMQLYVVYQVPHQRSQKT